MVSNYLKNAVLNSYFSGSNLFLGLSSTEPTAAGANITEPTGGSYARVPLTSMTLRSTGVMSNSSAVRFPKASSTWFTTSRPMSHWVLFNSAGTALCWKPFTNRSAVDAGTILMLPENSISIRISDV